MRREVSLAERMRALLAPSPYKESLKAAIIQQGIVLLLAAGILDGGDVFAICLMAVVAFWVGVWLVRPASSHRAVKAGPSLYSLELELHAALRHDILFGSLLLAASRLPRFTMIRANHSMSKGVKP